MAGYFNPIDISTGWNNPATLIGAGGGAELAKGLVGGSLFGKDVENEAINWGSKAGHMIAGSAIGGGGGDRSGGKISDIFTMMGNLAIQYGPAMFTGGIGLGDAIGALNNPSKAFGFSGPLGNVGGGYGGGGLTEQIQKGFQEIAKNAQSKQIRLGSPGEKPVVILPGKNKRNSATPKFSQIVNPGFKTSVNPGFNQGFNSGSNQNINPGFNSGFRTSFKNGGAIIAKKKNRFAQGGFIRQSPPKSKTEAFLKHFS